MSPAHELRRSAFGSFEKLCAELRRCSHGGQVAVITEVDTLCPDEAVQLVDLLLHDPEISMPFEPFGSLLSALIQKRPLGLWDLPGFDGADDEAFLRRVPTEHPECLACKCFPICQGYGAKMESCETWRAIIPALAKGARQLSSL